MNLGIKDLLGLLPVISALHLDINTLYPEVAIIAYHFHWSREECMAMSNRERRRWIDEIGKINKEIANSMKSKTGSGKAR